MGVYQVMVSEYETTPKERNMPNPAQLSMPARNKWAGKHPFSKVKRSRKSLKSLCAAAILFLLLQLVPGWIIHPSTVYHYRINYQLFLNDPDSINVVLDNMKKRIKQDKLDRYILLIGNSVAWGTNETSDHSLGRYLNDEFAHDGEVVFNLSLPSIQPGDAYTLLLMMRNKGIRTDNVMLGVTYSAFTKSVYGSKPVFWLMDDLRRVDKQAYRDLLPQMRTSGYNGSAGIMPLNKWLDERVSDGVHAIPIVKDKEILKAEWARHKDKSDLLGDPRPWYEKGNVEQKRENPQYKSFFNPEPFDLSVHNWAVYFMERIYKLQEGKRTLVFVAGGNGEMSKPEVTNPGYVANLQALDRYFAAKPGLYFDLQDRIAPGQFTDHVHLTNDGNRQLAHLLYASWTGKGA
ncbi:hypothetical protein [Paenibacillus protaetiae]|uniref:Uncharacterized protein n=1 Tax=Paenibacillus protaetiae TaxID=2509456 RepID=A0A4P6ETL1_9BACL|nr:hypothetical protein [Paenibacillus protaetiae]QAY65393.1 hypothetical protein ET464_02345 [Paenibacillus protaetiae]